MTDVLERLHRKIDAGLGAIKPPPASLQFDHVAHASLQPVVNALAMNGLAIVRNYVPRDEALDLGRAVHAGIADYLGEVNREQSVEHPTFAVNYALGRFKTFPDMVACPKPIFNMRHGRTSGAPDGGFVDVFKPELLVPQLALYKAELEGGLPLRVIQHFASLKYRASAFNLYVNDGVMNPRTYHIDADLHQVKAFVYLTDVLRLEDGPYCYVPGSHQETQIKHVNRLYNAEAGRPWTDMSLMDPATAVACLAPAGTLILSMQSGLHRGYPQGPEARRLMLVELFEPG